MTAEHLQKVQEQRERREKAGENASFNREDEDKQAKASVINRASRNYLDRLRIIYDLEAKLEAAAKIESWWIKTTNNMFLASRSGAFTFADFQAAMSIQKWWRDAHLRIQEERRQLRRVSRSATVLQSSFRGFQTKKGLEERKKRASLIQKAFRKSSRHKKETSTDDDGNNSLLYAVKSANKDFLSRLILKGWDLKVSNARGQNLLHVASSSEHSGSHNCVQLILESLTDDDAWDMVSAVDKDGKTPLHYAAGRGKKEVILLLLNKGAGMEFGCCPFCLPQGFAGLLENNGQYVKTLTPGCVCLCCPFENVKVIDLRMQSIECVSDTKTSDNVTVQVRTSIQFQVNPSKVTLAAYTIQNARQTMNALVDDIVRSELPKLTLDSAYESKQIMVAEIKAAVQSGMTKYGYEIISVLITDLRPDMKVLSAMNEINSARRLREAAIERAEAEKVLAVKAGEADAESKYLSGVGVSRMRAAITDGFNDSIKKMGQDNGLSPQEVVNMMLVTQYLDCLKDFAVSGKSSVIVPHGLGATAEMQSAVRNGMLQIPKMEG